MSKTRIVLPIEGMTCASCAATVQEALAGATGVTSAGVNFATNKAAIEYDSAQTNVGQLIKTVREAGYNCGKATVTFGIVAGERPWGDSCRRQSGDGDGGRGLRAGRRDCGGPGAGGYRGGIRGCRADRGGGSARA